MSLFTPGKFLQHFPCAPQLTWSHVLGGNPPSPALTLSLPKICLVWISWCVGSPSSPCWGEPVLPPAPWLWGTNQQSLCQVPRHGVQALGVIWVPGVGWWGWCSTGIRRCREDGGEIPSGAAGGEGDAGESGDVAGAGVVQGKASEGAGIAERSKYGNLDKTLLK